MTKIKYQNNVHFETKAFAKINISLEITNKRRDGYHDIRSILQTLKLADRVEIIRDGLGRIEVNGPYAIGVPTNEENLAHQALCSLAELYDRDPSEVSIIIEKNIPLAAGLGGGSSDAVAVLHLLQKCWPGIEKKSIAKVAALVGSDESFFLKGGTALIGGRGESIKQLRPLPVHKVLLFVPDIHIEKKTRKMFEEIKDLPFDTGKPTLDFAKSLPRIIESKEVFNSFERVAFNFFKGLSDLKSIIENQIQMPIHLTGAGPTLFWIGETTKNPIMRLVEEDLPCTVIETITSSDLVR